MRNHIFVVILFFLFSCTSADKKNENDKTVLNEKDKTVQNENQNDEKLTPEKAREVITDEINRTKNDVGGTKRNIKEFTVQSVVEKDSIFIIKYIWSGELETPSTPPEDGKEYKGGYDVKDGKAELKVIRKDNKWQVISD